MTHTEKKDTLPPKIPKVYFFYGALGGTFLSLLKLPSFCGTAMFGGGQEPRVEALPC